MEVVGGNFDDYCEYCLFSIHILLQIIAYVESLVGVKLVI